MSNLAERIQFATDTVCAALNGIRFLKPVTLQHDTFKAADKAGWGLFFSRFAQNTLWCEGRIGTVAKYLRAACPHPAECEGLTHPSYHELGWHLCNLYRSITYGLALGPERFKHARDSDPVDIEGLAANWSEYQAYIKERFLMPNVDRVYAWIVHESMRAIEKINEPAVKQSFSEDKQEKVPKGLPDNPDVRDLCHMLVKNRDRIKSRKVTQLDVARELTRGDDAKAKNLLRQSRRYRHLWDT